MQSIDTPRRLWYFFGMLYRRQTAYFTPPEAGYIDSCIGRERKTPTTEEVRDRIREAFIIEADSNESIAHLLVTRAGMTRYPFLRFLVTERWVPDQGETLRVAMSREELHVVKGIATFALEHDTAEAGRIDQSMEESAAIHAILAQEIRDDIELLSGNDLAILKGAEFEERLEKIATGSSLISTIDTILAEGI